MTTRSLCLIRRAAAIGLLAPFLLCGVTIKECPRKRVTPESYTWDFPAEANRLFSRLQFQSQALIDTAGRLAATGPGPSDVSWHMHANRLREAKKQVNEMNGILCRLAIIKPAVEPWQAKLIERAHKQAVLAAVHVDAAIKYLDGNRLRIENGAAPTYYRQIDAVETNARNLKDSLDAYTALASARNRVSDLGS
jgi:hypothetical protein